MRWGDGRERGRGGEGEERCLGELVVIVEEEEEWEEGEGKEKRRRGGGV